MSIFGEEEEDAILKGVAREEESYPSRIKDGVVCNRTKVYSVMRPTNPLRINRSGWLQSEVVKLNWCGNSDVQKCFVALSLRRLVASGKAQLSSLKL